MNNAARTAALLEVAAQAAAAGHGGKERIYDLACQQYGWSKPSLKRWLSALAAATGAKPRKRRSDAGTIALTLEHAHARPGALVSLPLPKARGGPGRGSSCFCTSLCDSQSPTRYNPPPGIPGGTA